MCGEVKFSNLFRMLERNSFRFRFPVSFRFHFVSVSCGVLLHGILHFPVCICVFLFSVICFFFFGFSGECSAGLTYSLSTLKISIAESQTRESKQPFSSE